MSKQTVQNVMKSAYSADPDEISIMSHFILILTIFQSTHLGVPDLQSAKGTLPLFSLSRV